jgi:hypothetical protein
MFHHMLDTLESYWMVFVLFKSDEPISRKSIKENHPFSINFPLLPCMKNLGDDSLVKTKWSFSHDRIELQRQPRVHSIGIFLLYNLDQCSRSCCDGRNWPMLQKRPEKHQNYPSKNILNNRHSDT